jgi:hypothetical protein
MRTSLPADVYDTLTTAYQMVDMDSVAQGIAEVQSRYDREPTDAPATVCVRLDGLADKIAATVREELLHGPVFPETGSTPSRRAADAVVSLLQSLAVQ